jgi:DNA-binding HxlR family transcriptional regulator/putative sterol carrier protein
MKTRSYNQLCGLAFALDVVGERWTLLVIRELFAGPRRFTDLMDGLPGISTNLLSERLKSLEYTGLLHRRILPPPAASMVYELTSLGRALEPALLELGKWGSQLIPSTPEGATILHLGSYALTPKTFFRPHLATDLDETYALYVGEETQQIHIAHGKLTVQQGEPAQADVALYTEPAIYLGLLQGELLIEEAIAAGLARVKGDKAALQRFLTICRIEPPTDGKPHTCIQ